MYENEDLEMFKLYYKYYWRCLKVEENIKNCDIYHKKMHEHFEKYKETVNKEK